MLFTSRTLTKNALAAKTMFTQRCFSTKIKSIGIVGAGQMGTGIGIVAARTAGLNVTMVDPSETSRHKSKAFTQNWCQKEISKERMTDGESSDVQNRIQYTGDVDGLDKVDFVVEAVNEDFELKKLIFKGIAQNAPDHAILATNTSSISISKIGGCIPERAHQVIGMHFMNPVPVMKLVEVITALQTDDMTLTTTTQLA